MSGEALKRYNVYPDGENEVVPDGRWCDADDAAREIERLEAQVRELEGILSSNENWATVAHTIEKQYGLIGQERDHLRQRLGDLEAGKECVHLDEYQAVKEDNDRLRGLIGALRGGENSIRVTVSEKYPSLYDVGIYYDDDYSGDDIVAFSMEKDRADALTALLRERQRMEK